MAGNNGNIPGIINGGGEQQHTPVILPGHDTDYPHVLKPDAFLPDGYDFNGDEMLVLPCGRSIPSVEFSMARFLDLQRLAETPEITQTEEQMLFAQYLVGRGLVFNSDRGCWDLPLTAEYDDKKRARYPHVTIKKLGFYNFLAHRATISVFRGEEIDGMPVDHLCRRHACCNPYHLEATDLATNTRRGVDARRREVQPTLFQSDPGTVAVAQLIARKSPN